VLDRHPRNYACTSYVPGTAFVLVFVAMGVNARSCATHSAEETVRGFVANRLPSHAPGDCMQETG
jgi:hypothetical protein